MAAFLPPITDSGREIGWVCFSADPDQGLQTGTQVENQAFGNFDGVGPWNPSPKEGPWVNTIDADAPNSEVDDLPDETPTLDFLVSWHGDDDGGSGITSYDIYVSDDGGDYLP